MFSRPKTAIPRGSYRVQKPHQAWKYAKHMKTLQNAPLQVGPRNTKHRKNTEMVIIGPYVRNFSVFFSYFGGPTLGGVVIFSFFCPGLGGGVCNSFFFLSGLGGFCNFSFFCPGLRAKRPSSDTFHIARYFQR